MSAVVRTRADHTDDVPFFHTFPLWVLDVIHAQGFKAADVTEIKVMPKTADVTLPSVAGPAVLKVRRADAFPGRNA